MRTRVIKLVIDNFVLNEYGDYYFACHPRASKLPVDGPCHPTVNSWMVMRRPAMNALKQRWKDFIVWFIGRLGYSGLRIGVCRIKFSTFYGSSRRHDADNSCPKFILDGLCESGFIVDDDCRHVISLTLECGVDRGNPRTEIVVVCPDCGVFLAPAVCR